MRLTDQRGRGAVDQEAELAQLYSALIQHAEQALRLSDDHYLVCWQATGALWCVINMAALDAHAEDCAAFRLSQSCEHLDRVSELCACERATAAAATLQQRAHFVARTPTAGEADRVAIVRR